MPTVSRLEGGHRERNSARNTVPGEPMTVEGSAAISFSPPSELSGPTVLYLKEEHR